MTEQLPPADPSARRRPPLLVWVAFGLSLFFALLDALITVLTWLQIQSTGLHTLAAWSLLTLYAVTTVLYVAVAIFLLRGASWARWTGIGLAGLNVAVGLIIPLIAHGAPNCVTLAPQIAILVILFRPDVVNWCRPPT